MRKDNIKIGNIIAKKYKKKYGIITYSGTLAIELALINSGLKNGDKVIISNNVCYSIINILFKLKSVPIVICPKNNFVLSKEEIEFVINHYDADGFLLIYQYGMAIEIGDIKIKHPNLIIIEDIAQAWNIEIKNYRVGESSDFIVTSFGKTKPLSLGIGGALLTNKNILSCIDFCDSNSRETSKIMYPYAFPDCNIIDCNKLFEEANKIVKVQRKVSNLFSNFFQEYPFIEIFKDNYGNKSVWHRFPIWINDEKEFKKIISFLDILKIEYQLPHKQELDGLEFVRKNSIIVNFTYKKSNMILLRTRVLNINSLKLKLDKLKKYIKTDKNCEN